MTDRPILMSGPMVRALLDGRKTMTRRLAWRKARKGEKMAEGDRLEIIDPGCPGRALSWKPTIWQKVRPCDRLWVRETWQQNWNQLSEIEMDRSLVYRADGTGRALDNGVERPWCPSIYMPRSVSRLTLVVTETKLESLQAITFIEAKAEGVDYEKGYEDPRDAFARLWNTLHKLGNRWDDNPEVVALTFTVHKVNIDAPS